MLQFLVPNFCQENGNGCHNLPDEDYNDGDAITDIVICCCDTELCNDKSNGAEWMYFSVIAISFSLVMAITI